MEMSSAVDALGALAHAGRLSAFRLLVRAGPEGLAAGEIARALDLAPSSLSFNLNALSQAGLVSSHRDGRSIIYRADLKATGALLAYLVEDCCSGSPEICAPLAEVLSTCGPMGCR